MKNEIRMSLILVLSFFMIIVISSIEPYEGYAMVSFICLLGIGGAFVLSVVSLIHMQLIRHKTN